MVNRSQRFYKAVADFSNFFQGQAAFVELAVQQPLAADVLHEALDGPSSGALAPVAVSYAVPTGGEVKGNFLSYNDFHGAIYTSIELPYDAPHAERCGSCTRCLAACPTDAFPAPFQLDARRCISYLTIEHKGPIPEEFREAIGNRIYGCDDCLAVCPWNRFADAARANKAFLPREELAAPRLDELLRLDDAGFRRLFAKSPIKRIGRDRLVRNAAIAAGNSGRAELIGPLRALVDDPDAVVAEAAEWALARLSA